MHTTAGSSPWPLGSGQWGTGTLAGYKYGYDAASRITGMESYWYNSGNDVGVPSSSAYSYDFTSQLTGADHSGLGDEAYSYDANGNRTMAGYSTGLNNLLQSDGTFSYVYDAEGNRIRKREIATGVYWAYTYDHRNRLVTVDEVDPSAAMGNLTGQGAGWGSPSASGETEEPETGWGPTSTYGLTGSSWG